MPNANLGAARRAAFVSIISNTCLVLLKLVIGLSTGVVSVTSEAIHSGVDLLAAVIAWMAIRVAAKPADRDHPYGHGKFENVSGTIEAALIMVAAIWIVYEAIHRLIQPQPFHEPIWAVGVMALSVVVNIVVSRYLFRVAKATGSVALEADAWHLRTDVWTSVGVCVALAVMVLGKALGIEAQYLNWLDPVSALVVAGLIAAAAWHLTTKASRDLVDVSLPNEELKLITDLIAGFASEIQGFHNLRTRKAGIHRFVEVHLVVDAAMNVEASHDIASRIEQRLREAFENLHAIVHIEPCLHKCSENCRTGCLRPEGPTNRS
jgi:cation diffusion facilitator family transporter